VFISLDLRKFRSPVLLGRYGKGTLKVANRGSVNLLASLEKSR
jgi:hypothetical protein